tara:strand:+ start:2739 stop:3422 length:684 start_codon:yes stop_codon:yes gene_type:complete
MDNIKFDSSNKNESPNKFAEGLLLGMGGLSLLSGGLGFFGARKKQREAEEKEEKAREEMNRLKNVYSNLDTSNPFANLENTMEDLTVNQQAADFQRRQFQQSQANILSGLRGAAGGSGVAALAQSLAQQGQIASERTAASIGQQEAMNQRLAAQAEARNQELFGKGKMISQDREMQKQATLLGMSQSETAAYMQQAQQAEQAKFDALTGTVGNLVDLGVAYYGAENE